MKKFTMAYQANQFPHTQVYVEEYADLRHAALHAMKMIEVSPNDTYRVVIREGDAKASDTIVWDSANDVVPEDKVIDPSIINRVDNMIADLAMLHTRMLTLKEEIVELLKV